MNAKSQKNVTNFKNKKFVKQFIVGIITCFGLLSVLVRTGCEAASNDSQSSSVDIEQVINEIFQLNGTKTIDRVTTNAESVNNCSCVLYYLCKNNSIVTDGIGVIDIRFKGVCQSYLEVCCNRDDVVTEPIVPNPGKDQSNSYKECGIRNRNGVAGLQITGNDDYETQFGEFPWTLALLKVQSFDATSDENLFVYVCGASLLNEQAVLTAAHCVTDEQQRQLRPDNLIVRAGEWDTKTKNEILPHQDIPVGRIVRHESFNPKNLFNDVAVLFLAKRAVLDKHIRPICLPSGPNVQLASYERCYATGWGKDTFGKEGEYQVIMKAIDLPLVPFDKCEDFLKLTRLGTRFRLHKSFVCAGGEINKDTCKGDGGGPLACRKKGATFYEQVGITAWGIGCGQLNVPGVYVNVAFFSDWIRSHLSSTD